MYAAEYPLNHFACSQQPVDIEVEVYNRGVMDASNIKIRMYDEFKNNDLQYHKDEIIDKNIA